MSPHRSGPCLEGREVGLVVDDEGCFRPFFRRGPLGGDHRFGGGRVEPSKPFQAFAAGRDGGIDEHHDVEGGRVHEFEEERNVLNQDFRPGRFSLGHEPVPLGGHGRVDDAVERRERIPVAEHPSPKCAPVEGTIRRQHLFTELGDDGLEDRGVRLLEFVDDDLANWYVRQSRARFWAADNVFTDDNNRKPFTTQKGIFLPRVGLAVRVNDKTTTFTAQ